VQGKVTDWRRRPGPRAPRMVGIVGLGAIGASIGLSLRGEGLKTVGFDVSRANLREARELGAIAEEQPSVEGLGGCGEIFVAVPPGVVVATVEQLLRATRATIVDVASVKAEIASAVSNPRFVPSHPLRGTHLSGPSAARSDLFAGGMWVVCPTEHTSPAAAAAVGKLIALMGAEALHMTPEEHDAMVATTSHLPHVTASSLVHVLGNRDPVARRLVAGGFLDTTRIARGNPDLWAQITMHNRHEVSGSIDELIDRLAGVKAALARQDSEELREFFSRACRMMEDGLPVSLHKRAAPRSLPAVSRFMSVVHRHRRQVATELGGAH
jgi:prephenate dehydrogenase